MYAANVGNEALFRRLLEQPGIDVNIRAAEVRTSFFQILFCSVRFFA
jgi:hypothetical protein